MGITEEEYAQLLCTSSDKYIPWHNTHSNLKGIKGLNRMYDSLDDGSDFKLLIEDNCSHLLKPMEENTGIPEEYSDPFLKT